MTTQDDDALRPIARSVLILRVSEGGDVAAVAAAAHVELAGALVPLIGQTGFDAITTRAMHLAGRDYPSAPAAAPGPDDALSAVGLWVKQQEAGVAMDAAATMLTTIVELLVTLIGESLTVRLLRKGWPDGFRGLKSEETPP